MSLSTYKTEKANKHKSWILLHDFTSTYISSSQYSSHEIHSRHKEALQHSRNIHKHIQKCVRRKERRGENEGQGLPPCSTDFPIFCTLHFTLWHGTSISVRVLHEKMKKSTWYKELVVESNKVTFSAPSYFNLTTFKKQIIIEINNKKN